MAKLKVNQRVDVSVYEFLNQMSESETMEMARLLGIGGYATHSLSFKLFIENQPLKDALHDELKNQPHYNYQMLEKVLSEASK